MTMQEWRLGSRVKKNKLVLSVVEWSQFHARTSEAARKGALEGAKELPALRLGAMMKKQSVRQAKLVRFSRF